MPPNQRKPPFWRECQPLFQIKFSAFHGNDENYMAYFKAINDYGLTWIHGYPSCIMPFASFVAQNGLTFDKPIKAVTASAENLYGYQRSIIEKAFGVPTMITLLTRITPPLSSLNAAIIRESLVVTLPISPSHSCVMTPVTLPLPPIG